MRILPRINVEGPTDTIDAELAEESAVLAASGGGKKDVEVS